MSFGWLIVVLLCAVLGADWWWPLRGIVSVALCAATSVLALPWAALTLRFASATKTEQLDPRQQKLARERRLWGYTLRLALLLLVATFLVSKWWLLLEANGSNAAFVSSSSVCTRL